MDTSEEFDGKLIEKLAELDERFRELEGALADPKVIADGARYAGIAKEHGVLAKKVSMYREYRELEAARQEAQRHCEDSDAEIAALAREELADAERKLERTAQKIREAFLTADEHSDRNVIMEIRGGTGGDEACLFAADLFRMYSHFATRKGWKVEVMDVSATELGGLREVVFGVEGDLAYHLLRFESGTHRVQRVPKTETQGRIHTSACTVAVLPEAEEIDMEIDPADLQVDTFRASGPGGQKVNKTSSAVRITHVPTGLVVSIQDEKSQHKNRAKAMKVLRSRLFEMKLRAQQEARASERRSQIGTGDRSEKIRTYNFPQNRVTDHRINFTSHSLDRFLLGEMDELLAALLDRARKEKMAALFKSA
ncbi:MAG: peptide chain release factor 1 [Planctomycetota bacterium]